MGRQSHNVKRRSKKKSQRSMNSRPGILEKERKPWHQVLKEWLYGPDVLRRKGSFDDLISKSALVRLVHSTHFTGFIALMIFSNAIFIGFQADHELQIEISRLQETSIPERNF